MKPPKILFISLLMMLFVLQANSQNKRVPKHKTKFSFGLQASPDFYVYDFKATPDYKLSYNTKFNYSVGGTFIYYPVKLITLRATLLYSKKGYSLDYDYTMSKPDTAGLKDKMNFDISYFDAPVQLNINIIHRDMVQLYISGGVVPGVLVNKFAETFFNNKTVKVDDPNAVKNFNTFIAGSIYSVGLKINVSERLGFGLEPYYRHYFNRIDKATMGKNPISFGGKFAILFNIHHKHHHSHSNQNCNQSH